MQPGQRRLPPRASVGEHPQPLRRVSIKPRTGDRSLLHPTIPRHHAHDATQLPQLSPVWTKSWWFSPARRVKLALFGRDGGGEDLLIEGRHGGPPVGPDGVDRAVHGGDALVVPVLV